ncbi:MAG: glycosyltransferase [Candidatus Hinthialibacter antarcticus]|nr:glycosyltransferase [Candidatus Hinthialibacter antarcticus]
MKVCDIVQFYSPLGGGVRRYIEDKSRRFADKPDIEHLVIIPSDQNAVEYQFGSKVYHIKSLPLIGSISYRMLLNQKRIFAILDEERPDIIEVGDPYRSAWIALEGGKRLNAPVVAFYHSDFPRALGRTIRRFCGGSIQTLLSAPINRYVVNLYNQMSATVVAGKRLRGILTDCGINNVAHIPLGTDVTKFHPNPNAPRIRKELGLSDNDTLILFVGRLAREKNIRALIRMMDELKNNPGGPGRCHLLLVGDGELRRIVERALSKNDSISWFRYCTDAEHLTAYYSAADIFLHAGVYETFGLTSLEAQACGTRVIIVNGGGMEDTVEGEEPLITAQSPHPADLAEAVRKVRALPHSQPSEQRRQRMVENFSIEMTIDRLVMLYHHLLDGKLASEFTVKSEPHTIETHEPNHSTLFSNRP